MNEGEVQITGALTVPRLHVSGLPGAGLWRQRPPAPVRCVCGVVGLHLVGASLHTEAIGLFLLQRDDHTDLPLSVESPSVCLLVINCYQESITNAKLHSAQGGLLLMEVGARASLGRKDSLLLQVL